MAGPIDVVVSDRDAVTQVLAAAGCVAADDEADELIAAAGDDPVRLAELVARRRTGEPLAWLTGTIQFCGVTLRVAPGVYVARWQTELMTQRAAALLPAHGTAVDLCTGTGAIAAVLAATQPTARVVATELDASAARCARSNGVEVFEGFLDDPLPSDLQHRVDVLTAVVAYVPTDAIGLLPIDVQRFEPRLALDGGPDGTVMLAEVVHRSSRWLRPGGWIVLELGGDQAELVGQLLRAAGFGNVDVLTDDDGDARAICAQLLTTLSARWVGNRS